MVIKPVAMLEWQGPCYLSDQLMLYADQVENSLMFFLTNNVGYLTIFGPPLQEDKVHAQSQQCHVS